MKVRHTGEVRYFSIGGEHVPYEFEFYQQPHLVGGGVWYPIGDYKNYASKQGANPAAGFMTVRYASEIPPPPKKCSDLESRVGSVLMATLKAMPKELYDKFTAIWDIREEAGEATEEAAYVAMVLLAETFPAEFLAAAEAIGGWPPEPELLDLQRHLEKTALDKAMMYREERRAVKDENRRRGRAERDATASSSGASASATAATPLPVAIAPVALSVGTEADRAVERANEEAKQRKLLAKRAAVQASLAGPAAVAEGVTGQPAVEKILSKNARRRQERKAKQQREGQRRIDEKQQRVDEEFRKVLKAVEPLRQESGTVVQEDLECLDSLKKLDIQLKKEEKQMKPRRAPTQAEAEVTHALLETGQLRGKMRQEVEAFVRGFAGIAPDAEGFAERLVDALLTGDAGGRHDAREAAELYGDFADAYASHGWSEQRLQRARRRVVLRAAALA